MGKIKEEISKLADLVQDLLDEHIPDNELDSAVETILSNPNKINFYHAYKNIIMNMIGIYESTINENNKSLKVLKREKERIKDHISELADKDQKKEAKEYLKQIKKEIKKLDKPLDEWTKTIPKRKNNQSKKDYRNELSNGSTYWNKIQYKNKEEKKEDKKNIDESCIIPKLDEGCCGGKKRPTPIIRRPTPKRINDDVKEEIIMDKLFKPQNESLSLVRFREMERSIEHEFSEKDEGDINAPYAQQFKFLQSEGFEDAEIKEFLDYWFDDEDL